MLVIQENALHPAEKSCKAIEHLLRIFAINGNKPVSQDDMGKVYRKFRPYTGVGEGKTEEDPTSSIRAHTSAWLKKCIDNRIGGHSEGKDGCLTVGYHRLCQKRPPNAKHRNRIFWVDKEFAKNCFRLKTKNDVDEMADMTVDKSTRKRRIPKLRLRQPSADITSEDEEETTHQEMFEPTSKDIAVQTDPIPMVLVKQEPSYETDDEMMALELELDTLDDDVQEWIGYSIKEEELYDEEYYNQDLDETLYT